MSEQAGQLSKRYTVSIEFDKEVEAKRTARLLNNLFSLDFTVEHDEDSMGNYTYFVVEAFDTFQAALAMFNELDGRYHNANLSGFLAQD